MNDFVNPNSIVRKIWGDPDIVLFIFAGAAAEFSLNKAVDWLYFTGKLPKDPLGRLLSTVVYAKKIVFSERAAAHFAIDQITAIHQQVENARATQIPDWAYRDVLFMLIYYSIAAFETLERNLTLTEKEEIFEVFNRVGIRMKINGLPGNFIEWQHMHELQLDQDLIASKCTIDLFKQYKKHLGLLRYLLMKSVQALIVPPKVKKLLQLGNGNLAKPLVGIYRWARKLNFEHVVRNQMLPSLYKGKL